jgi:two-component system chemotaxis response regulator CheY
MSNSAPITIALVDDDSIFQLTASRMLRAFGEQPTILQFSNGEEALRYLLANASQEEDLPDLILLDINMPNVDGWAFLNDYAELKKQLAKKIVIYMVSSSIDPSDINRAKNNVNVSDYLIKPILKEGYQKLLHSMSDNSAN